MDLTIYPGGLTGSQIVENNLRGIELEKAGRTDEAVALYEQNVAACFDGSHPYNRLALIGHASDKMLRHYEDTRYADLRRITDAI